MGLVLISLNLETYYQNEAIKHVQKIEYILNHESFIKKQRRKSVIIEGIDYYFKEKKEFNR